MYSVAHMDAFAAIAQSAVAGAAEGVVARPLHPLNGQAGAGAALGGAAKAAGGGGGGVFGQFAMLAGGVRR